MKKINITKANVRIELDFYLKGSVIKGTIQNGVSEVRSYFEVTSEDNTKDLIDVITLAKQGCFAESLVRNPVPLKSSCILNGERIELID
jgi:hypothetical protein